AQQQLPQWMGIAANHGVHDRAAIEVHGAAVIAHERGDRQRAGLAIQIEELEDVVNAQLVQRALDSHQAASSSGRRTRSRSVAVRMPRSARRAWLPSGAIASTRRQVAMASA